MLEPSRTYELLDIKCTGSYVAQEQVGPVQSVCSRNDAEILHDERHMAQCSLPFLSNHPSMAEA